MPLKHRKNPGTGPKLLKEKITEIVETLEEREHNSKYPWYVYPPDMLFFNVTHDDMLKKGLYRLVHISADISKYCTIYRDYTSPRYIG